MKPVSWVYAFTRFCITWWSTFFTPFVLVVLYKVRIWHIYVSVKITTVFSLHTFSLVLNESLSDPISFLYVCSPETCFHCNQSCLYVVFIYCSISLLIENKHNIESIIKLKLPFWSYTHCCVYSRHVSKYVFWNLET